MGIYLTKYLLLISFIFFQPLNIPPKRIVSLAPSITEELYLLGVEDRIVGVTSFCLYPEEAKEKEKVGSYLEPNIEKIFRLKPDIIFVIKEGYRKEVINRIESLGLKVFVFQTPKDFRDIANQFLLLGELVGKDSRAEEILKALKKRIKVVKINLANNYNKKPLYQRPKIFWQLGMRPLITVAKDTYMDQLIQLAGGINIAHNSRIRYPYYSQEEVLRENPDAIILVTMGGMGLNEMGFWRDFESLKAVKRDSIYIFDATRVATPNPVMFVETLERLCNLLYESK